MTNTFPLDVFRPAVTEVAESVFDTMLGIPIRPFHQPLPPDAMSFTAAVYYAGEWRGALLVECLPEHAFDWARRLMSLTSAEKDDARDGLGEIANVLAGNLKPLLPSGVSLSIPSVVEGSNYSLRVCGGTLFERLTFADPLGPFCITLVEVIADPAR